MGSERPEPKTYAFLKEGSKDQFRDGLHSYGPFNAHTWLVSQVGVPDGGVEVKLVVVAKRAVKKVHKPFTGANW